MSGRSRRRVVVATAVTALVLGTAGFAAAGGRHDSDRAGAHRPTPTRTDHHKHPPRPRPTSTATGSPTTGPSATPTPTATGSPTATSSPTSDPGSPGVPGGGSWWHPAVGISWQWQLSGKVDLSANVAVYDLDLFDTTPATVAAIHAKGAKAICYLETGGWEKYRPDAGAYPASVLGKTMGGYPDERYVDIRQLNVLRPIIDARLDLCAQKGFDGVEPDIDDSVVDVGAAGIGFPASYADQLAFNRMVAADAHARGLAIGLKNGTYGNQAAKFVADMQPSVDFAVNEECVAAGNACGPLAAFPSNGKPVFHTEYLGDYVQASSTAYAAALNGFCPVTRPLRFSSILKDASASLTAWRQACP